MSHIVLHNSQDEMILTIEIPAAIILMCRVSKGVSFTYMGPICSLMCFRFLFGFAVNEKDMAISFLVFFLLLEPTESGLVSNKCQLLF